MAERRRRTRPGTGPDMGPDRLSATLPEETDEFTKALQLAIESEDEAARSFYPARPPHAKSGRRLGRQRGSCFRRLPMLPSQHNAAEVAHRGARNMGGARGGPGSDGLRFRRRCADVRRSLGGPEERGRE